MTLDEGLTALEVLGVAIKSEVDAAALYARLAGQVHNHALLAKLDFLRQEEEKHRVLLQDLYARRFPDVELRLSTRSLLPSLQVALPEQSTVPELFQLAMLAEQVSANFYSHEAERAGDEAGRIMLRYLANVERGHFHMVETEYDLVSRFPEYYSADEFHIGDELMHIGP
jgi:rubrerythrin